MHPTPPIRQIVSTAESCPEGCGYCPGLGLTLKAPLQPGREAIGSCSGWSSSAPSNLATRLLPGKFLQGQSWKRLVQNAKELKSLVVLLPDGNFDPLELMELSRTYTLELWVVILRGHNVLETLARIPSELRPHARMYCPQYDGVKDSFLTASEINELAKMARARFPEIEFAPPKRLDLHNPTLDPQDLALEHSVKATRALEDEIDISVIIPTFNNGEYVERVVRQLFRQKLAGARFEIIVVDDGSDDGTEARLAKLDAAVDFKIVRFPRRAGRSMGDSSFRAGLARTLGTRHARGRIFAFLDADILVPPDYIERLRAHHADHDVVQVQRLYLKREISARILEFGMINKKRDIFHPEGGYWQGFFADPRPWAEMPAFWKYACTYGLSVTASKFNDAGGFRSVFNSYGFEDTDLGYRLAKQGARFVKSPLEVYHLWHPPQRSEFGNSDLARLKLLRRTANIFYRHNLDPEVFSELSGLLHEERPLRKRIASFLRSPTTTDVTL